LEFPFCAGRHVTAVCDGAAARAHPWHFGSNAGISSRCHRGRKQYRQSWPCVVFSVSYEFLAIDKPLDEVARGGRQTLPSRNMPFAAQMTLAWTFP